MLGLKVKVLNASLEYRDILIHLSEPIQAVGNPRAAEAIKGCQRVGIPGLGSRLSTCCPTKRSKWRCSQHTSADQTPIHCVPVASPRFKQKGRVCMRRVDAECWNAGPGPVDTATRHILGKFAVGTRCADGDRLLNFAPANHLVVSSLASNTHNPTLRHGSQTTDALGTKSTTY